MKHLCLLFAASVLSAPSWAMPPQPSSTPSPAAVCKTPPVPLPQALYGQWQLSLAPIDGDEQALQPQGAVVFERHPEYAGSVRGRLQRRVNDLDVQAHVAGDVEDGEFVLDESADGVRIDAVWVGALPPQGCHQEIRGTRRPAEGMPGPELRFLLRKTPGWR